MSTNTPDTTERRGALSARIAASEMRRRQPAVGVYLDVAIRPSRQARNSASGGSAELTGLPVSGVGLDDPARTDGEPKGARLF